MLNKLTHNLPEDGWTIPSYVKVVWYEGIQWRRNKLNYFRNVGLDPTDIAYGKMLHQYVYLNEIGPYPAGHIIHHIDGNYLNQDPTNLQPLTPAQHNTVHFGGHPISPERAAKISAALKGNHNFPKCTSEAAKKGWARRKQNQQHQ